jgi:predicted nicotinamide N-methyase
VQTSNLVERTVKARAQQSDETLWCFETECVLWSRGLTPLQSTATYLSGAESLRKEGVYWSAVNKWKRLYLTRNGISLVLVEDVPEAGGQNCIWTAGLVMAQYLEYNSSVASYIRNKRLLELGAGCGLTSLVASVLGATVFATEQDTCMPYLKFNLSLNPDIIVTAKKLHWINDYDGEKFDVILGCDITYDVKMIKAIFLTISQCLHSEGSAFICHDNDSCPMSSQAFEEMLRCAEDVKLRLAEELYSPYIPAPFQVQTVKMWTMKFMQNTSAP